MGGGGGGVSSLHLVSRGHCQTPATLAGTFVCVSQHVFPIWVHPLPQRRVRADLFPLFLFFRVPLMLCSLSSRQNTSLTLRSFVSSLSLPIISCLLHFHLCKPTPRPRACLFDTVMSQPQLFPARYQTHAVIPSSLSSLVLHPALFDMNI